MRASYNPLFAKAKGFLIKTPLLFWAFDSIYQRQANVDKVFVLRWHWSGDYFKTNGEGFIQSQHAGRHRHAFRMKTKESKMNICSKALTLFLSILLLAKSGFGKVIQFEEISAANKTIFAGSPNLIILGDPHSIIGLPGLIETLINQSPEKDVNCIFFELPAESQTALDRVVQDRNFNILSKNIRAVVQPAILKALQESEAGFLTTTLAKLAPNSMFFKTFPLNQELVDLASRIKLNLLTFDVNATSTLYSDSLLYTAKNHQALQDIKVSRLLEKSITARNIPMAEAIRSKFRERSCITVIVIVGNDHLRKGRASNLVSENLLFQAPLQEKLSEVGLSSVVLRVEKQSKETIWRTPRFTSYSDDLFPKTIGAIFLP
jgi:hypothetical protein